MPTGDGNGVKYSTISELSVRYFNYTRKWRQTTHSRACRSPRFDGCLTSAHQYAPLRPAIDVPRRVGAPTKLCRESIRPDRLRDVIDVPATDTCSGLIVDAHQGVCQEFCVTDSSSSRAVRRGWKKPVVVDGSSFSTLSLLSAAVCGSALTCVQCSRRILDKMAGLATFTAKTISFHSPPRRCTSTLITRSIAVGSSRPFWTPPDGRHRY